MDLYCVVCRNKLSNAVGPFYYQDAIIDWVKYMEQRNEYWNYVPPQVLMQTLI